MTYHTCIFDLDGTLLDTLQDLANAANHALAVHHFPQRTIDEIRSFVGNGIAVLMERCAPEGTSDAACKELLDTFRSYYMAHMTDTTGPYAGILSMLQDLNDAGCQMAVVSNKLDPATKELNARFFSPMIPVAIGAPPEFKKPHPYSVFSAIRELSSSLSDAIYIGDSDVDLLTAANAGIPCIGVSWGFRGREFLLEHGASHVIDHPSELLVLLASL